MTADLDTRAGELYAPVGKACRSGAAVMMVQSNWAGTPTASAASRLWWQGSRRAVSSSSRWSASWTGPTLLAWNMPSLRSVLIVTGGSCCRLLDDHLALRAVREQRLDSVVGHDEVTRSRVEGDHRRVLGTVFGEVTVSRMAYRAPGHRNLHPADAALNLPVERHSHGLRKLAALEAARGSFDDAAQESSGRADSSSPNAKSRSSLRSPRSTSRTSTKRESPPGRSAGICW